MSGDEVLPAIKDSLTAGNSTFKNIYTGEQLSDWSFEPIYAQCYLGGLGIALALEEGADVVICGRVSDASPVIGAAYWWHNWRRSDLDQLANAFIAGHLIECSNYICGGNFTGFKSLEHSSGGWDDIGYPIAEISHSGAVVITKQKGSGGIVSVDSCSSQLLYEIQGPWYFNSDVTAVLDSLWFDQLSTDRVAVRGVKSAPPPPTTKVGITARGGYQAEISWFLCGLDIPAKARMLEAQLRKNLKPYSHNFSLLSFTILGSSPDDPQDQNSATVTFRCFAQARKVEHLMPDKFLRPIIDNIMQGYPGVSLSLEILYCFIKNQILIKKATFHLDLRQGFPKPLFEYYVTLLPQSSVQHVVHLPSGQSISVPPPTNTRTYPLQQPSSPATVSPPNLSSDFGPTTRGPLGWIVHARSGDKGSDCNCGFWVRSKDEYSWLRTLLSIDTIRQLLGKEYNERVTRIDRFELPELRGVHFLLNNLLDRGVTSTSSVDFLGKVWHIFF